MWYNLQVDQLRVRAPKRRVQESEAYMHNRHERHLDQIEGQLLEVKEALWDKPDRDDLEYQHNEVVSNLEEIHDDVRETKDEQEDMRSQLEDVRSQVEVLAD
jgi:septation ring formation regulator EzrA